MTKYIFKLYHLKIKLMEFTIKSTNRMLVINDYSYKLICLYCFLTPLGTLAKFGDSHTSIGMATILLLLTIAVRLPHTIRSFKGDFLLRIILVFLGYMLLGSLTGVILVREQDVFFAYQNLIMIFIYLLFAASIASLDWDKKRINTLAMCLACGLFISSTLTLIDYFQIVDIPKVNDEFFATWINDRSIEQMHGPFAHRTSMAVYLSMIIPFLMLMGGASPKGSSNRLFLWAVTGVAFLTLLLSHNRSAPLAIIFIGVIMLFVNQQHKFRLIIGLLFVCVIFSVMIYFFFPSVIESYLYLFEGYSSSSSNSLITESDSMRLNLFLSVLTAIAENPFGMGFTNVYTEQYGWYDPHSVWGSILHAGGIVSFFIGCLVTVYFFRATRNILNSSMSKVAAAIVGAIFAWSLLAFMHNVIFVGLLWMFIGIFVAINRDVKLQKLDPSSN